MFDERIKFEKGQQKNLISYTLQKLKLSKPRAQAHYVAADANLTYLPGFHWPSTAQQESMLHFSFRTIDLGQPNVGTWVKFSSVATRCILAPDQF